MFFTRIGSFLTWAGFIFGCVKFVKDILVVFSSDPEVFAKRYGSVDIDQAIYVIFISIALGVLVEISRKL